AGHEITFHQLEWMSGVQSDPKPEAVHAWQPPIQVEHKGHRLMVEGFDFQHEFDLIEGTLQRLSRNGVEMLDAPARFSIWRAPTDNDMHVKEKWCNEGYDRAITKVYQCDWEQTGEGAIEVRSRFSIGAVSRFTILRGEACWRVSPSGAVDLLVKVKRG
ncbi:glycoside hydrolase family 2, partial [Paenibacillus sepulcri]|nr:glycoside hydrolase family 2 [Paenibacillus sepulcri]